MAEWDFTAPKPCPYDASANTIAARGMQMLYQLYLPSDPKAAQAWLERANKVIADTLAVCGTGKATLGQDGKVNWGEGGWETILKHSTINGNDKATRRLLDHGLVCECCASIILWRRRLMAQMPITISWSLATRHSKSKLRPSDSVISPMHGRSM